MGQEVGGGCVHTGGSGHVGGAVATAVVGHGSGESRTHIACTVNKLLWVG